MLIPVLDTKTLKRGYKKKFQGKNKIGHPNLIKINPEIIKEETKIVNLKLEYENKNMNDFGGFIIPGTSGSKKNVITVELFEKKKIFEILINRFTELLLYVYLEGNYTITLIIDNCTYENIFIFDKNKKTYFFNNSNPEKTEKYIEEANILFKVTENKMNIEEDFEILKKSFKSL
jgi:hypothetical protein